MVHTCLGILGCSLQYCDREIRSPVVLCLLSKAYSQRWYTIADTGDCLDFCLLQYQVIILCRLTRERSGFREPFGFVSVHPRACYAYTMQCMFLARPAFVLVLLAVRCTDGISYGLQPKLSLAVCVLYIQSCVVCRHVRNLKKVVGCFFHDLLVNFRLLVLLFA